MIEGEFNNAARTGHTPPTEPADQKRCDLLRVIVLATISAVIGAYLIASSILICKDGVFYIGQAQQVGHDLLGVAKRYPPAYPLSLFAAHAVARWFVGNDSTALWVLSSQITTLLLRTLALIVLFLAGRRLVGSRRSFHAVVILCVLPYAAHDGSDVLREWPVLLVIAGGLWLLLWAVQQQRWHAFGWVGLLAGGAIPFIQRACNWFCTVSLDWFCWGRAGLAGGSGLREPAWFQPWALPWLWRL